MDCSNASSGSDGCSLHVVTEPVVFFDIPIFLLGPEFDVELGFYLRKIVCHRGCNGNCRVERIVWFAPPGEEMKLKIQGVSSWPMASISRACLQ